MGPEWLRGLGELDFLLVRTSDLNFIMHNDPACAFYSFLTKYSMPELLWGEIQEFLVSWQFILLSGCVSIFVFGITSMRIFMIMGLGALATAPMTTISNYWLSLICFFIVNSFLFYIFLVKVLKFSLGKASKTTEKA